jgi:hypothetical protein
MCSHDELVQEITFRDQSKSESRRIFLETLWLTVALHLQELGTSTLAYNSKVTLLVVVGETLFDCY